MSHNLSCWYQSCTSNSKRGDWRCWLIQTSLSFILCLRIVYFVNGHNCIVYRQIQNTTWSKALVQRWYQTSCTFQSLRGLSRLSFSGRSWCHKQMITCLPAGWDCLLYRTFHVLFTSWVVLSSVEIKEISPDSRTYCILVASINRKAIFSTRKKNLRDW